MQIDEHRLDLRKIDGEAVPIHLFEHLAQLVAGCVGRRNRDREDVALSHELHVRIVHETQILDFDPLPLDGLPAFRHLRFED